MGNPTDSERLLNATGGAGHEIKWERLGRGDISGVAKQGCVIGITGSSTVNVQLLKSLYCHDSFDHSSFPGSEKNNCVLTFDDVAIESPISDASYISLEDLEGVYGYCTFLECLRYSFNLRTLTPDKTTYVDDIIQSLKVDKKVVDSYVRNLTRVEKLLLLLGCECVANKNVIFLENFTDNLSEEEAVVLLSAVRNFAADGRIIFLSISELSQYYFDFLTHVQILTVSGSSLCYGDVEYVKDFLSHKGFRVSEVGSIQSFLARRGSKSSEPESIISFEDFSQSKSSRIARPQTEVYTWNSYNAAPLVWHCDSPGKGCCSTIGQFISKAMAICRRSALIRLRNYDMLLTVWIFAGVMGGLALLFGFYGQGLSVINFQNKCAFLSVIPFGVMILTNFWYKGEYDDKAVYTYERKQGFNHTIMFPSINILTDLIVVRLMPAVLIGAVVYDGVGLNPKLSSQITFFMTLITMMIPAVVVSKLLCVVNIFIGPSNGDVRSAITFGALMCFMVLYAGFLMNLTTLPSSKYFARDWSIFYWGCNNLYYAENDGLSYELATVVTNNSFNPFVSNVIYVKDLPQVCAAAPPWCAYCANGTAPRIHPNYTCVFHYAKDLCNDASPIHNTSLCTGVNNGTLTLSIPGDALLKGFGIIELGTNKVYQVLLSQASVYFIFAVSAMIVLHRCWTVKDFKRIKSFFGLK